VTSEALAADQIRVRVYAAGLNRADLLDAGRSDRPLPGRELAGDVIELGSQRHARRLDGIRHFTVGGQADRAPLVPRRPAV
jgi:NADPH:quinone reductase-like Zn-dependent oxidoreductase